MGYPAQPLDRGWCVFLSQSPPYVLSRVSHLSPVLTDQLL